MVMSSYSVSKGQTISILPLKLLPELEEIEGHRKETEKKMHLPNTSGVNSENTPTQNIKVPPKFNIATQCDLLNKMTNETPTSGPI